MIGGKANLHHQNVRVAQINVSVSEWVAAFDLWFDRKQAPGWDSNWFLEFQTSLLHTFHPGPAVNPGSQQQEQARQALHHGLVVQLQLRPHLRRNLSSPSQSSSIVQSIALQYHLPRHGGQSPSKDVPNALDNMRYIQVVCLTSTATPQDFQLADPNDCTVFWNCRSFPLPLSTF